MYIYRHPHSTNLDEFISYFNKCLPNLNKENKDVYITGDFNIDLLKYDTNPKYQEFYNLVTAIGFYENKMKKNQVNLTFI